MKSMFSEKCWKKVAPYIPYTAWHHIPENNTLGPITSSYPGTTILLSPIYSNDGESVNIFVYPPVS
jgi:hypothetical protein